MRINFKGMFVAESGVQFSMAFINTKVKEE